MKLDNYKIKIDAFYQENKRLVSESIVLRNDLNRFKNICYEQTQMITQLQQILTKYQNQND